MRVGIVAKRDSEQAVSLASDVAEGVNAPDVTVVVDETTHDALAGEDRDDGQSSIPSVMPVSELSDCDLGISVGGDGTFLFAARAAGSTPLLGINLGEVGFLTAVEPDAAVETARRVVDEVRERGSPRTMDVPRLAVGGPDWTLGPAVNEVVLQGPRRGHGGGLDVTVAVDGQRYASGQADGALVATPLGSTAYNLSEGGPLVQPGTDALVVTGMADAFGMPPLVVRGDATVCLTVDGAASAVAVTDGLDRREIRPPADLEVGTGETPLSIAEPSLDFFTALSKLE